MQITENSLSIYEVRGYYSMLVCVFSPSARQSGVYLKSGFMFSGPKGWSFPESGTGSSERQAGMPPVLEGWELEQPSAPESINEQLPHQELEQNCPGSFSPPHLLF